jgi:Lon protease-like protein
MRPDRIPVFPLNVVLLPGMPLPLHIFEPRYKLMIGRCLSEKLEFGMVLESDKGMATVGCTAAIQQKLKDYPDGRMDILTEGRVAFRLLELLDEKEYYEGRVDYLPEDHLPQDSRTEARLTGVFRQVHSLLLGQEWASSDKDPGLSLAYRMASRLPLELEEKQQLLEMRAENERRDFLLRWLTDFLPKLHHRQRVRQRAGGNGHGLN